jgi:biotin carboxyl carrier protein
MPSQIVKILATEGQSVKVGDPLIILSSMKMENTITCEQNGIVEEIYATEGASVSKGFLILKINSTLQQTN